MFQGAGLPVGSSVNVQSHKVIGQEVLEGVDVLLGVGFPEALIQGQYRFLEVAVVLAGYIGLGRRRRGLGRHGCIRQRVAPASYWPGGPTPPGGGRPAPAALHSLPAGRSLAFGAHSRMVWRNALSHRSYTTTSGFSASSTSTGKSVKVSGSGYLATSHGFTKTARRKFSATTFCIPCMKLSPNITSVGSERSSLVKTAASCLPNRLVCMRAVQPPLGTGSGSGSNSVMPKKLP